MSQSELLKRIWNLDAATLKEIGADDQSIREHAEIELDEDLERLERFSPHNTLADTKALEEAIRVRHRLHWINFSSA